MIVNVNQCASMFDETLHVFKFSAVAKQVSYIDEIRHMYTVSITSLILPQFCACHKLGCGFPMSYVMVFYFVQ
jgi:hypothetical protein